MFAALGPIIFQTVGSPESFEASRPYDYPEHKVIGAKPRIQFVAPGLETVVLAMKFHTQFTNPATAIAQLRAAADPHQALSLVFGNGTYRGRFVIEKIAETIVQQADDGSLIAIEAKAELKEWAPGAEMDPDAPPKPDFVPLGISYSGKPAISALATTDPAVANQISPGAYTSVPPAQMTRAAV